MVMIWKRDKPTKELPSRIKKLDNQSLMSWMDSTLMNVGMAYDAWRYKGKPIEQVNEALDVLNDLWEELASREIDR
jgi:hypothetical protein